MATRAWRMVREYRARKAEEPSNPMWSLRLADALERSGQAEAARHEYHVAAREFLRQGFARKARSVYGRVLDQFPDDLDAQYGLACAQHEVDERTGSSKRIEVDEPELQFHFDLPEATLDPEDFDFGDMERTVTPEQTGERRRTPRIGWVGSVELFDGRRVLPCQGSDVSTTGLCIADIDGVDVGHAVKLAIAVPRQPWTGSARGRIARSAGARRLGIDLEWIDPLTMRHIVQTIAQHLCVSPRVIRQVHRDATRTSL